MSEHRVVVVGAGIGGLVCALQLACRGLPVTLVEAAPGPGGKLRSLRVDGADIDAGPTVFTMRGVFEDIFAEAGASLSASLPLAPLNVLARHAWRGHPATLDLLADGERSSEAVGRFAGAEEARRFDAFRAEARRLLDTLEGPYIRSARPTPAGIIGDLGLRGLAVLAALGPFATLAGTLARRFRDPRLQQLFNRYATYCGASPWSAPATLMLVAQVEMDGVWTLRGGMHALARALADLAAQRGVQLRYGTHCERILVRHGRAAGVVLEGGETLEADSVVFNGDSQALASGLLGDDASRAVKPMPRAARSLSALTWAMHVRAQGFPLVRHNVFFDDDYASEFDDILRRRQLPRRGTVYLCAQDRGDGGEPIEGRERLLALVNAPPEGDRRAFDEQEIAPCEHRSWTLMRDCGLVLSSTPQQVQCTTPADFHRLFPATGGALYGMATHGWTAVFKRPGSQARLPGLYLCGGSVHPGPGLPMAAMSGRLAAATLLAHLGSTSRSPRVVISGGTSTRSATMAGMRSP
ncbi:MAG: FAD-dependent oxidoreductase [Rubrivivax sp.]